MEFEQIYLLITDKQTTRHYNVITTSKLILFFVNAKVTNYKLK